MTVLTPKIIPFELEVSLIKQYSINKAMVLYALDCAYRLQSYELA